MVTAMMAAEESTSVQNIFPADTRLL
jgi:hypothetical protein